MKSFKMIGMLILSASILAACGESSPSESSSATGANTGGESSSTSTSTSSTSGESSSTSTSTSSTSGESCFDEGCRYYLTEPCNYPNPCQKTAERFAALSDCDCNNCAKQCANSYLCDALKCSDAIPSEDCLICQKSLCSDHYDDCVKN